MTRSISGSGITSAAGYTTDALHLIETQTASASATIDFVLPAGYFKFVVAFDTVVPATDNVQLYFRTSTDGGSTFDSGASNYRYAYQGYNDAAAAVTGSSAGATFIPITHSDVGSATDEFVSGEVNIYNPAATAQTAMIFDTLMVNTGSYTYVIDGVGRRLSAADVDAIQFLFSSGNIASGTFKLYGWVS